MAIDPAKSTLVAEYKHDAPLLCCSFDPSGRFVLAGGRDRDLLCIPVNGGATHRLEGHESWVSCAVRAGTELVLTADMAGRVIAWNCAGETPQLQWTMAAHVHAIQAMAISTDGQLFATGDRDGAVRVWKTADGVRSTEIPSVGHPITALAFHPDGVRLACADRQPKKPRLKLWDFSTVNELRSIDVPQLSAYRRVEDIEWGGIRGIACSSDGKTLVVCGSHDYSGPAAAFLFDTETGEQKRKLASTLKGFCYAAKFHPQGFLMTVAGDVAKGEFRAWDPEKDESLGSTATAGPCTSLDLHSDSRRFVITQMQGKGSYPETGLVALFAWEDSPAT